MKSLQRSRILLSDGANASRKALKSRQRRTITSSASKVTLGIRKEDPGRLWERRCPVTPDTVHELVRDGVDVLVQPCERRVWSNDEFVKAGAQIHPTLEPANIVIGIKETPLSELDRLKTPVNGRERTHVMFSHTAKGQLYNMPLLSRFVAEDGQSAQSSKHLPRLVDYELLTGADGKRVVGFGWFAGAAGLVEGLIASALDFLSLGVSSPFLYLPRPYSHPSLNDMRRSLRSVGEIISTKGMPKSTGPFVIAVTGNGNVATGALDLLKELPTCFVKAQDLPGLVSDPATDLRKVYVVHVPSSAYLSKKQGSNAFDREDYYANPDSYESHFHERIAPYTTVLINGTGWALGCPRILPTSALPETIKLARNVGRSRFRTIADISCDINGGIEFVGRPCTIDDPFFYCDASGKEVPAAHAVQDDVVQIMSIDILPSELPLDASQHFSKALDPYLRSLVRMYQGVSPREEDRAAMNAVDRATIARSGKLLPKHAWLGELSKQSASPASAVAPTSETDRTDLDVRVDLGGLDTTTKGKAYYAPSASVGALPKKNRALLLGSGMVAKPAVDELLSRGDVELVIASNNLAEAEELARYHDTQVCKAVRLDASDKNMMNQLVSAADIVVSLLPAPLHPPVAELCIEYRKHLVTASYISPAMESLDSRAKSSDVLLLNEIGLDPGIDHCSAVDLRDRIEREGHKIVSFASWCGGLPAPEHSDIHNIPGQTLLSSHFPSVPLVRGLALEGLANRDSLPYAETYGLGSVDSMWNVFRGTLRYQGFARILDVFREIGLLSTSPKDAVLLNSSLGGWQSLVASSLVRRLGDERVTGDVQGMLRAVVSRERAEETWNVLEELSMVPGSCTSDLPPLPSTTSPVAPLDLLTTLLAHKLRYKADERDMVALSHEIISVPKSSSANRAVDPLTIHGAKKHTSTLLTYGTPSILGASAMARTVGLPLAIAALKVLDGKVAVRGVKGPGDCGRPLWGGVLEGLEERGITMKESVRLLSARSDPWKLQDEMKGQPFAQGGEGTDRLTFDRMDREPTNRSAFK
ncbi:hypothetical protein FRB90_010309 [Tulasnella sp. 427]|nr:hypothetical protein FRB90_010309 [Tulasnella sp. 427]